MDFAPRSGNTPNRIAPEGKVGKIFIIPPRAAPADPSCQNVSFLGLNDDMFVDDRFSQTVKLCNDRFFKVLEPLNAVTKV
jgi:hypothetical protein